MSNKKCVQLSGGVVIAESWLTYQFKHPALVWVEDSAPRLFGCHYDAETRQFFAPDETGQASETVVYTAPVQP